MVGIAAPGTRRLLLVTADQAFGERWVSGQLSAADLESTLWVAGSAPPGVQATPAARVVQQLGSECRLLVFNAYQGFHPDAFAAAVGTLRGGGDCVLLAPPLDAWATFADPDRARFAAYPRSPQQMHGHFLARLALAWRQHPAGRIVTAAGAGDCAIRLAPPAAAALVLNAQQHLALATVERVAHGHARRPLVLTADRGRGKSTLLGVAAARLLQAGLARVTVVAPHRAAVATLFRHALQTAGLAAKRIADTRIGDGLLCFRLPAECLSDPDEELGLVLVDEAAAIPVAVLRGLLEHSNRLVFASTVHGYEGSGRGFDLRFRAVLEHEMPQWRALRLELPVRWDAHDPLEDLVNRSFLLDVDLDEPVGDGEIALTRLDSAQLAGDEPLLRSVFGLLVNAHYQTRPSDLRQLLDDPDSRMWLARQGAQVVGVLLASLEGGFDSAMLRQVVSARRRPRGHLLAQSLAVHAGLDACLEQRVLRVQRIAVHPQMQRRGVGRRLLQTVSAWGVQHGFDLLGCAFGATAPLLAFWRAAGFSAARLGVRVDPASAAHSLFMLHGLSPRGRTLTLHAERRFLAALPWSLGASLRDLDSALAALLLQGRDCSDLAFDDDDARAVERIAAGSRQPATADDIVWKALVRIAAQRGPVTDRRTALIAWRLQHHAADRVCRGFSIAGRRALDELLRAALREQELALWSGG